MALCLLVIAWQLVTSILLTRNALWPTPLHILSTMRSDGWSFYWVNIKTTLWEAAQGFFWGNLIAIAIGVIIVLLPITERPLIQLSVVVNCAPIVAIGPILVIFLSGDMPKVVLAAMSVFFTTLIGTIVGLRAADRAWLDVSYAYGGNWRGRLTRVSLPAAFPSLFAALRIAGPAAVLGAILGEYFGGTKGLGVAMINSEQSLDISRTWGIALVSAALGGLAYLAAGVIGNILSRGVVVSPDLRLSLRANGAIRGSRALTRTLWRVGAAVTRPAFTVGFVLLVWIAVLKISGVSSFIARYPSDVWRYFFGAGGAGHISSQWHLSLVTLRDAGLGLLAGTGAAVLAAMVMTLWRPVESAIMPIAMVLRSVPLVAMTPLIVGIFGRNLGAVTVIAGLVTFFPTLVNVTLALARAPQQTVDVVKAYGGSELSALIRVKVPVALPALFASLRIAAPLAITGALLAEWLATGQGLGYDMITAATGSEYDTMWADVVLVAAFATVIYNLLGGLEYLVMRRYASQSTG